MGAKNSVQLHAIISGRVQGVFFRAWVQTEARSLGLNGWVQNLPDGSVELIAEGKKSQLDILLERCKQGPPSAKVENIKASWKAAKDSWHDFLIRR